MVHMQTLMNFCKVTAEFNRRIFVQSFSFVDRIGLLTSVASTRQLQGINQATFLNLIYSFRFQECI